MGLKLKIFCGYFVLVILSVFLIFLFYNEQAKKRMFRKSEQELANMHRLVEKAYISLLDLASQAEMVSVWNENDFTLYQEKRKKTCSVLIDLKQNAQTAEQQMRLDSLCLLLEKKEHLLITITDIYNKLAETDETMKGKIPAIVTQVHQSSRQLENIPPANVTQICFLRFLFDGYTLYDYKDINRRNCYKNELEASDRKNRELLHSRKNMMLSIAHDLRSPLTTIQGYAELLPGEEEKSRQEEYAKNIVRSSRYMLGLINTLIEFYLLDTGRRKPNDTLFHLEAFFKETENNYKSSANRKQILLTTNFSSLNVVVNADRSQLQQVVNNLLSNSNGEQFYHIGDTGFYTVAH